MAHILLGKHVTTDGGVWQDRLRRETMETADSGAAEARGYSAADASHVFEEFLEERLSLESFTEWLQRYPYAPHGPSSTAVEDEINRATLAVRALERGTRDWEEVRRELLDARSRLTGLARF